MEGSKDDCKSLGFVGDAGGVSVRDCRGSRPEGWATVSYFNEHQESYMKSMEAMPLAEKCWCGWYRIGECPNCKTARTCAEKVAFQCSVCHNDGGPENRPIIHLIGCTVG